MKISGCAVIHIDQNEGILLDVSLYDNMEEAYQNTVEYVNKYAGEEGEGDGNGEYDYTSYPVEDINFFSPKSASMPVHRWDFGDYGIYIVKII